MKKSILAVSILVSLILLGGVVWAAQRARSGALRWDAPDWDGAYISVMSDAPITATFAFSGTVRLVDADGTVLDSQAVEAPGCEPQADSGEGQCGSAFAWSWETDDYPREVITEQIKMAWSSESYPDLPVVWVPSDCDLSGAGCMILFEQDGWEVGIPDTCREALSACGTFEDAGGWWFVSTFEGTEPWTRCLPDVAVGGTQ